MRNRFRIDNIYQSRSSVSSAHPSLQRGIPANEKATIRRTKNGVPQKSVPVRPEPLQRGVSLVLLLEFAFRWITKWRISAHRFHLTDLNRKWYKFSERKRLRNRGQHPPHASVEDHCPPCSTRSLACPAGN